jgi:hypothetical protein
VFAGEQPAVDRELQAQGLLMRLMSPSEFIPVVSPATPPRPVSELRTRATELIDIFTHAVLGAPATQSTIGLSQT